MAWSLSSSAYLSAQDWKTTFPEAEAVYTQASSEVTIKQVGGKLIAIRTLSEDLQLVSDNAVKMMSRGHIYHSSFNELRKWEAYTKLPNESKKVKVTNISTNSSRLDYVFYDDSKATSFDFAGIGIGATRHIEYELVHNDLHLLTPHYFDEYFPLIKGELKINFPPSVKLKYIVKGIHADKVIFTESKKKDKITYTFTVSNLPAMRTYGDAPGNAYYATHIVFFIEKMQQGNEWKNFLASPDDLYRYNYGYIKDINKNVGPELKRLTDSLVQNAPTAIEKARRIYKWVQSHIKYVAFEEGLEGFIPREANLVLSRHYGDCKDMASILTVMLNHAGVSAYLTWIGTRRLPYTYHETPLPIVDNHMICAAQIDGRFIFLDGTDETCIFDRSAQAIQDKEALIAISDKEYKIVKVDVPAKGSNSYVDSTFLDLSEGELKGHIKIHMKGYFASSLKAQLNFRNEEERKEYLKSAFSRGNNKIEFSNWNVKQTDDNSEVFITAQFVLPGYARKIGNEWLLNLNLFKKYEHEEIDFPKRKSPIEFDFLNTCQYITTLKIPAGFKVSYVPKSQEYKNDVWGFKLAYEQKGDMLYLTQQFDNDWLLLQPSQFEQWNKVLEHLFPHYKQSVVLTKQ